VVQGTTERTISEENYASISSWSTLHNLKPMTWREGRRERERESGKGFFWPLQTVRENFNIALPVQNMALRELPPLHLLCGYTERGMLTLNLSHRSSCLMYPQPKPTEL